jgi:hypothetical protein
LLFAAIRIAGTLLSVTLYVLCLSGLAVFLSVDGPYDFKISMRIKHESADCIKKRSMMMMIMMIIIIIIIKQ